MKRFLVRYHRSRGANRPAWYYLNTYHRDPLGSETQERGRATRLDKCWADAVFTRHRQTYLDVEIVEVVEAKG